jgi:DNA repair exonuclease SbcCD ATPase subunit
VPKSEQPPQTNTPLERLHKELDAALSSRRQLEAQVAQLQSANADFAIVREELTTAVKKHQTLEAQFMDFQISESELELVKSQLLDSVESNKRLQAEVSRLKLREAELSKDLAESLQIQEQLTTRISELLKAELDPDQARKLRDLKVSSFTFSDLERKIAVLEVNQIDFHLLIGKVNADISPGREQRP